MASLTLEERIDRAAQHVVRANLFYQLWWYYEGSATRPAILDTMNRFSDFFRIDSHAHLVALVVYIHGLFESRKDTINFDRLRRDLIKDNRISAPKSAEIELLIEQAKSIASKVAKLRHEAIGHRTASSSYNEVFALAAIKPNEFLELTEIALKIANRLLKATGQSDQVFRDLPRSDLETILKHLAATPY